jgi:hypothetical protein
MVHLYTALLEYDGGDWKEFLDNIGLLDVFGELLGYFNTPSSAQKIIRYIVWTYSANSERIVVGQEWESTKRSNYGHAGLPGDLWEAIGMLKDLNVARTIHRWLEYQDEPVFKQLQSLRDLKLEMQISSVGKISKSSGEIDYDQKYKNAQYAVELDKMIRQLENQSIHNNPILKDAIRESKFTRKTTTGPEAFSK